MLSRTIDIKEIRSASSSGPARLKLHYGQHHVQATKCFKRHIYSELCVRNDIVLRGTRIVLPKSLRSRAMKVSREDHAGVTRWKHRLRSTLFTCPWQREEIGKNLFQPCSKTIARYLVAQQGRHKHMNRELQTTMPSIYQTLNNPIATDVKKTDADSKQKSKSPTNNK